MKKTTLFTLMAVSIILTSPVNIFAAGGTTIVDGVSVKHKENDNLIPRAIYMNKNSFFTSGYQVQGGETTEEIYGLYKLTVE